MKRKQVVHCIILRTPYSIACLEYLRATVKCGL